MTAVIMVKEWSRFQHYKDRDPPWIKLYRDMLSSEAWLLGTDLSRLVQIAITLLAARYSNEVPYKFSMLKKATSLDCSEPQFKKAVDHLVSVDFLEIRVLTKSASAVLAPRYQDASSEAEAEAEAEAEQSRDRKMSNGQNPSDVDVVFEHWQQTHNHPKAALDAKRHKLIHDALKGYAVPTLCQSITGYRNSPFHMGQNDKGAVYDSIEVMLRNPKQIDAGLKFYESPPAAQSTLTRKNVAATDGWLPPEMRNAKH
jgi:hypothetical protein